MKTGLKLKVVVDHEKSRHSLGISSRYMKVKPDGHGITYVADNKYVSQDSTLEDERPIREVFINDKD